MGCNVPTGEEAINTAISEVLGSIGRDWKTVAQPIGRPLEEGGRPDVLITAPGLSPVIIETEIIPARTVEKDARERLGKTVRTSKKRVSFVVAVKVPKPYTGLKDAGLRNALRQSDDMEYAMLMDDGKRFPDGWLVGGIMDIALAVQTGMVSGVSIRDGAEVVEGVIDAVAEIIGSLDRPAQTEISKNLQQPEDSQTWRMAGFTLLNAVSFHDRAAGPHGIPLKNSMTGLLGSGTVSVGALISAWELILEQDYYPIFHTACAILRTIDSDNSMVVAHLLFDASEKITQMGLDASPDLYGEVFQRTISDQKKLAAFYTRPETAIMLAIMTLPEKKNRIWEDADEVKRMEIADFACGTGSLLLASYRVMLHRYGCASGRSLGEIHGHLMENCFVGADVLPMAAQITAATLAGVHPKKEFSDTRIYAVPQGGPQHRIGSLEWIMPEHETFDKSYSILTSQDASNTGQIPKHGSCDVVIMNPPFSSSKGPGGQADAVKNYSQAFEAFGVSKDESESMRDRTSKLFKKHGACANLSIGFGTHFMDLATAKIKHGGHLGLILPMTVATGSGWKKFRELLSQKYTEVKVVTFGMDEQNQSLMSGGTGMGELMLAARRCYKDEISTKRASFASIQMGPRSMLEAIEMGRAVIGSVPLTLEGGPRGGTPLKGFSDSSVISCPIEGDAVWEAVGIRDHLLLQMAYSISRGELQMLYNITAKIKTVPLGKMARMGMSHLQIRGNDRTQGGQNPGYTGPFNSPLPYDGTATYPALWNNDNEIQTTMTVSPDKKLIPLTYEPVSRLDNVWKNSASCLHLNLDLRTTSQKIAVSYTERQSIGGRAWPSIFMKNPKHVKPLAVWGNSTLGILCRWAVSGRQHLGKSIITRTAALNMPVLDFGALGAKKLHEMEKIFKEYHNRPFQRIMNLADDPVRISLDEALMDTLESSVDLSDIRQRLCAEPSVRGSD